MSVTIKIKITGHNKIFRTHLASASDTSLLAMRVYRRMYLLAIGKGSIGKFATAFCQDLFGCPRRSLVLWGLFVWLLGSWLEIHNIKTYDKVIAQCNVTGLYIAMLYSTLLVAVGVS